MTAPSERHGQHGLHGRNFRLLWVGETSSAVGSAVGTVALPLVALTQLDAGVVAVGLLEAFVWLPWLVVGLPAGAWVDRLSPRRIMIWSDAVAILALVSVPGAAAAGCLTLAQLFGVALAEGLVKVFFSTSYRALIPSVVPTAELTGANARLQGAESAAQIGGPGFGGGLAQAVGAANALIADAASFVVSLGCLLRMRVDEPRRAPRGRLRAEIAVGIRVVRHDPLLRTFALTGALANLALSASNVLLLVFLVDGLGFGAGVAGLLLAVGGVGGVLGAAVVGFLARRVGTARAVLWCSLAAPVVALLMPLAGRGSAVAFFVAGQLGMLAGIVAGNVLRAGFQQAYCPPALFGRISTTHQVVNCGAIPLGAVLGGVFGAAFGYRTALVIVFVAYLAFASLLLLSPLRRLRDLPNRRMSEGAGRIVSRDRDRRRRCHVRRAGAGRPRPRAARSGAGRARAGLHPRRRRHRQDPGHHPPHRLRGAHRRGAGRPVARGHLHRSRRR